MSLRSVPAAVFEAVAVAFVPAFAFVLAFVFLSAAFSLNVPSLAFSIF